MAEDPVEKALLPFSLEEAIKKEGKTTTEVSTKVSVVVYPLLPFVLKHVKVV